MFLTTSEDLQFHLEGEKKKNKGGEKAQEGKYKYKYKNINNMPFWIIFILSV